MVMKRGIIYIAILILILGLSLLYVVKGHDTATTIKGLILPELELITGKKFVAEDIVVNMLPLFVEMQGVKVFDDKGNEILAAEGIRGYIGISGLIKNEIILRRLVINDPEIHSNRKQIEDIIANIKENIAKEIPFKVPQESIDIKNATVFFEDGDSSISAEEVTANITLSSVPKFRISSNMTKITKEGLPEIYLLIETNFLVREDYLEIKSFEMSPHTPEVKMNAVSSEQQAVSSKQQAAKQLTAHSSQLTKKEDWRVSAKGRVKSGDSMSPEEIFLDLKVKGAIYLETLMGLLSVKEPLKGYLNFEGKLSGYLNDPQWNAEAILDDGSLFGIYLDRLTCNVSYSDGVMRFSDGSATLYGGTADVEVMIKLPYLNYFSLNVKGRDLNSNDIFELIGWNPHISEGKVSGEISSSGSEFNPEGSFSFKGRPVGGGILDRIKSIESEFNMENSVLHFSNTSISTAESSISTTGSIDLLNNKIGLKGDGKTADIKDFFYPYFSALSGPGDFQFGVSGTPDDPSLDVIFSLKDVTLATEALETPDILKERRLNFDLVEGSFSYRKENLTINDFFAHSTINGEFRAMGNVYFRNAEALFELEEPEYNLDISAKNIAIENLSDIFKEWPPFIGNMDANLRFTGGPGDINVSGDFSASGLSLYGRHIADYVDGSLLYEEGWFLFSDLNVKRGDVALTADGRVSLDAEFSFVAEAEMINLIDAIPEDIPTLPALHVSEQERLQSWRADLRYPLSSILDASSLRHVKIKGEGTFGDPAIKAASNIYFDGDRKGRLELALNNRHAEVVVDMLDGKLNISGNADLTEALPWALRVELQPARYDFAVAPFLKDPPEDLLVNLAGSIVAEGDRNHINAVATINDAQLYLYGTSFINSSDIIVRLEESILSIESFSLKSDTTEFRLSGDINIGEGYNLTLEGSSSIAPTAALLESIDVAEGNAYFTLSLFGEWNNPQVGGSIAIENGILGLRDLPYLLTSMSAHIYLDNGKAIIERATGRLSGGDVILSGVVHLDGFSVERFFIESQLKGITASISRDLWVNFDGNLYYRGNMESQAITGDIQIKRAKYSGTIKRESLMLNAFNDKELGVRVAGLNETDLNIRVSGNNFVIDNDVVRASMEMAILLRGTIGRPILLGSVKVEEGVIFFKNNEFEILEGRVDFRDPDLIDPYFDIVAETRVRNYDITINIDGYMERFNLAFSSNPSLNETDIFSLLAVGQRGGDLAAIGTAIAIPFLTGELQDVLEERLKTISGLDRICISPHVSNHTGTIAPRVTAEKRLLGDRLHVTHSISLDTGREQVWELEYILGDNISLAGLRDGRGSIGGDVVFRFEFR